MQSVIQHLEKQLAEVRRNNRLLERVADVSHAVQSFYTYQPQLEKEYEKAIEILKTQTQSSHAKSSN